MEVFRYDDICIDAICHRSNGLVILTQVCAIPAGYQKKRSQIWHLTIDRAYTFVSLRLINFTHQPGRGKFGHGSIRMKSHVAARVRGMVFRDLCEKAARESNLAMPPFYQEYLTYPREFAERRDRFRSELKKIVKEYNARHV